MNTETTRPNWRERLAALLRSASDGVRRGSVLYDESGLTATVFERNGTAHNAGIEWREINGVVAFKRDLLTTDLICLRFTNGEWNVEINEEMSGWTALIDALPTYLPGTLAPSDWWDRVSHPAFAANPVVLFSSR
jgi:hypothetical protein